MYLLPTFSKPVDIDVYESNVPMLTLTAEQSKVALAAMDPTYNVVAITGAAGTGKSTVIKHLRDIHGVDVCATTGKAAMNIDGCTVDSMFAIDRNKWKVFNEKYLDYVMTRTSNTLLIDESSMIGHMMAEVLAKIIVDYNKRLILVGDWGQATPVKEYWPTHTSLFAGIPFLKLIECHRQKDGDYLTALNELRLGTVSDKTSALFKTRECTETPAYDWPGICMFATNARSNAYNQSCFLKHLEVSKAEPFWLEASVLDVRRAAKREKNPLSPTKEEKLIDDSPFANNQQFAVGTKVVMTTNEENYVNGDVGIITEVFKEKDTIRKLSIGLLRTENTISVERVTKPIPDAVGEPQFEIRGFPITLGYGLTVHKSQGMTVDKAWVDIESITHFPEGSRHGLGYVALSRTRTLEGLSLSGWDESAFEVDEKIRGWL